MRLSDPATGALATGVAPALTRQLTLNEVMADPVTTIDPVTGFLMSYPGGPLEVLVNNTSWNGESTRPYDDFTAITSNGVTAGFTETPREGDTEVWELVNLTADAHPIHLHLVQFQVINRQMFDSSRYIRAYEASFPGTPACPPKTFCHGFGPPLDYRASRNPLSGGKAGGNPDVTPYLRGHIMPPAPHEAGWKDTVMAMPGQVTRVAVRWAPTDVPVNAPASAHAYPFDPSGGADSHAFTYVWHCHIIDHEDNEMMRPTAVFLNGAASAPAARVLRRGVDY